MLNRRSSPRYVDCRSQTVQEVSVAFHSSLFVLYCSRMGFVWGIVEYFRDYWTLVASKHCSDKYFLMSLRYVNPRDLSFRLPVSNRSESFCSVPQLTFCPNCSCMGFDGYSGIFEIVELWWHQKSCSDIYIYIYIYIYLMSLTYVDRRDLSFRLPVSNRLYRVSSARYTPLYDFYAYMA